MNTFKRILKYFKPYKKYIALAIICSTLFAIMNGATVYLSSPLLDTLFKQSGVSDTTPIVNTNDVGGLTPDWVISLSDSISEKFNDFVFAGTTTDILLKICLMILIAFFLKNLFGYLQNFFLIHVEQGLIRDIRNVVFEHIHKLPMSFFKKKKTGDLISRLNHDVYVIQTSAGAIFLSLFREPISILVFFGIAFSISWELTLFSIAIVPVSILFIGWIGLKLRTQSTKYQQSMGNITSLINESILGVKVVKAFGMENYENEKFQNQTQNIFKIGMLKQRVGNLASPITEFLAVAIGVVIIYLGSKLVLIDGSLKASEFMVFLFAIFQMMPSLKQISTVNNRVQETIAAGDRIFEILDIEPTIKNIDNPIVLDEFKESIIFENVSFHYDDSDVNILHGINFTAEKGKVIALVGSSGAGKTTMVDLVARYFDITGGRLLIDGYDIKDIKIESLRKHIGIVTQETILFNASVKENIAYGLKDCPINKIEAAAKSANAHEFIMNFEDGYDTVVGERGTKISGGQRQRLSIARALLKNPPIMIFDEATSSLDNESEVLVQQAIERLMKDRTTFVIAHRLSTVSNADEILVLDKGQIVQRGTHSELLKEGKGFYKKLYELQFREF